MEHYDVAPLAGFDPEIGILLASLQDSTREWRENLGEDIPIEAITWQASPGGYSVGGLLLHLIDCEVGWFHGYAAGNKMDDEEKRLLLSAETDQDNGIWPVPPAQPLSWYYALHDRLRVRGFESLRGIPADRVYGGPPHSYSCTLRWIVAHVVEHDSYTGGQAVALHELWQRLR